MQVTISKWGNSLAVRIPVEMARALKLADGVQVECSISTSGAIELIRLKPDTPPDWMLAHFASVNERLTNAKPTTPTNILLRNSERY
jgi:antitoxin MazE